jgi:hypothetical protein
MSFTFFYIPLQPTTDGSLLRLQVMAKVESIPVPTSKGDDEQKADGRIPVLVHVMAPVEGLAKEKRAPIDLVTVIDISCEEETMNKRLDLLNKAMEFLFQKIGHIDRLAIICSQSAHAEPTQTGLSWMGTKEQRDYGTWLSTLTSTMTKNAALHV